MPRFLEINGVAIHYSYRLSELRPTIVFINSLGTDYRIWGPVLDELGDAFSYLLHDMRGHGLSELGNADVSIETYANDLSGLLDHFEIQHAVICGLSIGGLVAQCLCGMRPQLIDGLILSNTASKIGTPDMWNNRIGLAMDSGIATFADDVLEKWFTPNFHLGRTPELAGYKAMLVRQLPAGYAAACGAIRDADYRAAASKIMVPTLVVAGDQDGSTPPELVEGLAKSIPGSRFQTVEGAAHIPCVEQPVEFARLIEDFIAQLGF